jgi:hypothetical protein
MYIGTYTNKEKPSSVLMNTIALLDIQNANYVYLVLYYLLLESYVLCHIFLKNCKKSVSVFSAASGIGQVSSSYKHIAIHSYVQVSVNLYTYKATFMLSTNFWRKMFVERDLACTTLKHYIKHLLYMYMCFFKK